MDVPGLGDPNVKESNSLAVVDVANPAAPRLEALVRTGLPFGEGRARAAAALRGSRWAADTVFVSNGHNDSITVVDARTNRIRSTIPIRIAGLETLRGVLPIGLAYAPAKVLLVAEAGINAIGVIDTPEMRAAWATCRRVVSDAHGGRDGVVYAVNAKGRGTGPNTMPQAPATLSGHAAARLHFGLRASESGGTAAA